MLGASPVLGYKVNDYLDGGVVLNYVYTGSRDVYDYNDKLRQHVYGPGILQGLILCRSCLPRRS
ncbi:hypothetical protein LWM68_35615 [Niabella sp. W65]|nr:hypothetical protein [Niabella sp. W65]MCH7367621.1 hypothetical protein [Niabella sp. W65]